MSRQLEVTVFGCAYAIVGSAKMIAVNKIAVTFCMPVITLGLVNIT
jgi:hypothetical protein